MINVVLFFFFLFSLLTSFNYRVMNIEYSVCEDERMEVVKCIPNAKECTKHISFATRYEHLTLREKKKVHNS